jgi:hypothetical protein
MRDEHPDPGQTLRPLHNAARLKLDPALKGRRLRIPGYLKKMAFSSTDFLRGVRAAV